MKIGITGHQVLPETGQWEWTRAQIVAFLDELPENEPKIGISCLAPGADSLFAEVLLEKGGILEVILPFYGYESRLEPADGLRFENLLRQAQKVEVVGREKSDEAAYFEAGKRVVEECDVLVAVWNGLPAAGLGGPGDVVAYAKELGRALQLVNPLTKSRRPAYELKPVANYRGIPLPMVGLTEDVPAAERPRQPRSKKFLRATLGLLLIFLSFKIVSWGLDYQERKHAAWRIANSTYRFPNSELAALDRVVQERFAVVPTNDFGMMRVGKRHEYFRPVTPLETQTIKQLRAAKLDVVFYMAGRQYLFLAQKWPDQVDNPLQGPIYMTGRGNLQVKAVQGKQRYVWGGFSWLPPVFQTTQRPSNLPEMKGLSKELAPMLQSTDASDRTATPDGKDFKAQNWNVAAVPVRASDKACVDCHRYTRPYPPRLGEPLGIALYVWRPAKK